MTGRRKLLRVLVEAIATCERGRHDPEPPPPVDGYLRACRRCGTHAVDTGRDQARPFTCPCGGEVNMWRSDVLPEVPGRGLAWDRVGSDWIARPAKLKAKAKAKR